MMKRWKSILLLAFSLMLLAGCTGGEKPAEPDTSDSEALTVTDWTGRSVQFTACPQKVVALSGSLGEVWLNAGGTLAGTTDDAVKTRHLDLAEDTVIVGSIKEPELETILSLEPDFVILDADIESHCALASTLEEMKIPCGLFHEEYFEDYLGMLRQFCTLTGRDDLYEENGEKVGEEIKKILAEAPDHTGETVLLLRAYSSGVKAKGSDTLAGVMLADFGLENVLDRYDSLLEELSMEEILTLDPDYIVVTTMGKSTQSALDHLDEALCSDPAWQSLTAVKAGHFHVLPKELFHYKPNARWAEAYQYLGGILEK